MRSTYKAPVATADDAAIIDWLVAMQAARMRLSAPGFG